MQYEITLEEACTVCRQLYGTSACPKLGSSALMGCPIKAIYDDTQRKEQDNA